jgi:hypothetical protein
VAPAGGTVGGMEHPGVAVGTPEEYAYWKARLSTFLRDRGGEADELEQIDARLNYRENRMTLYRLYDPKEERSVADTISHEILHALLYQMEELRAARAIDRVGRPAGHPERVGGI